MRGLRYLPGGTLGQVRSSQSAFHDKGTSVLDVEAGHFFPGAEELVLLPLALVEPSGAVELAGEEGAGGEGSLRSKASSLFPGTELEVDTGGTVGFVDVVRPWTLTMVGRRTRARPRNILRRLILTQHLARLQPGRHLIGRIKRWAPDT